MNIKIEKSDFLDTLITVSEVLKGKTTFPILECVLIEAEKDKVSFTATDNDITIKKDIKANVIYEGKIAIDGLFLKTVVSNMPDGILNLFVDKENNCNLSYGENIEQNFMGKDAKDFPKIVSYEKENFVSISEYNLKNMIEKSLVTVATTKSDNKLLNGIFTEAENDEIKFSSMDLYKFSVIKQKIKEPVKNKLVSIIPYYTFQDIFKILNGDIDKEVKIIFNEKNIAFEFENTVLISNIISGKYFDTEKIKVNDYSTKITVDKKELYDSINRTKIYTNDVSLKPIILNITDNNLNLSVNSMLGNTSENIKIEKTGNDMSICFEHSNILSILKILPDGKTDIYFNKKIMVIKDKKESYYYLAISVEIR